MQVHSTYRITGTVYPENRLVEFELGNATLIADEEFVDPEVEDNAKGYGG